MGEIKIDEQASTQADDATGPGRHEVAFRENFTMAAEIALVHQFVRAQRRVTFDLQPGERGTMPRSDRLDDQLTHVQFPAAMGCLPARMASR